MDLTDKKTIIGLLRSHGLWFKKSLGQNFLVDKSILDKIIEEAEITSKDTVLEIGPGLGILTKGLCQRANKVLAIEKDEKLTEILVKTAKYFKNLKIINKDVLKIDEFYLPFKRYKLVANIPYNITGPILKKFLNSKNKPYLMILMVQKEVAEKIVAKSGNMSILSISVQFYANPKIVQVVSASSFWPKPKVDSAILKITEIKPKITKISEKSFFRCVKIGFSSPRKTLLNNLVAGYQLDKQKVKLILQKVDLKEIIRAQELSIYDWQKLAKLI